jgi:hypothetical protein
MAAYDRFYKGDIGKEFVRGARKKRQATTEDLEVEREDRNLSRQITGIDV